MRILIVSENFVNGGLETNINTTVQSLTDKVEFFYAFGRYNEKWNLNNVFTGFSFSMCSNINQFIDDVRRLTNIINENNIDVVHAQPFYSLFPAVFAAKICGKPVVYTYHGTASFNFPCYINDTFLFDMLMDFEVDKIFSVSHEGKKIMQNIVMQKDKIVFLPNSIDTDKFCKTKPNKNKSWALVSRLDNDKIKEIKRFISMLNDIDIENLHIYGDGGEKEELGKFIVANKLNDKVILEGHSSNLSEELNGKYSGVIGIGRVAMEAISMGFPTIIIGYNKISGVIDFEKYQKIKYENFVNKNLQDISKEDIREQIKNINNNYYDKRFYKLFRKEFSSKTVSKKYYDEVKNITNISMLDLMGIYKDIQNLDGEQSIYNNKEVYNILKKHLSIYIRQPHQKNLIIIADNLIK